MHSFESFSFVIITLSRFISYHERREGKVASPAGKTWRTSNRRNKKHKRSEDYSRTHRLWSRLKVVEQILDEKLILLAGFVEAAVEILHERFGKTQQTISAHIDELLKLPTCTWDKPGQLRTIYDKIKINVRGLESVGVKPEQYGSFLIPVIMSRLPAEVRLHVARVSTKDV